MVALAFARQVLVPMVMIALLGSVLNVRVRAVMVSAMTLRIFFVELIVLQLVAYLIVVMELINALSA